MNVINKILRLIGIAVVAIIVMTFVWAKVNKNNHGQVSSVPPKPPVPITLTFRKALLGAGDVAKLQNDSQSILPVGVKITRPGVEPWNRSVVIDPGKTQEIGSLQGWAFAPGDVIEISAEGFESSKTRLNN